MEKFEYLLMILNLTSESLKNKLNAMKRLLKNFHFKN